ncbi:MAG TPA: histone deacetylase [Solirubrobacteraceae bacterium]|nr:histone deacetylase [Solirubrobacteraceae bacterium]
MRFWTHDRLLFPLPPGHRFPLGKYRALRERVEAEGLGPVEEAPGASWESLALVHDRAYLERLRDGGLTRREERALGLPWSPELVERGRHSSQGTVEAARDAAREGFGMNLGGGTHHAAHAAARGYCLFNDVVLAIRVLRREAVAQRFLVIDTDVHQGDGTAELLADDPGAYALSIQGGGNYPFVRAVGDLDVDLPNGTGDEGYLTAMSEALDHAMPTARPDLMVFIAGADPWEGDALGRLALTKSGLRARDALVLERAASLGVPLCTVLGGGYAPDIADTVEINLATARAIASRHDAGRATSDYLAS